jgi:mRNA interferase RelE/StbE
MYQVLLAPPARRALELTLPVAVAHAAWEFIRGPLAENPHRVGKPLHGDLEGLWSARRGSYRVVYSIDDEVITIVILRIAHRRDAYRP